MIYHLLKLSFLLWIPCGSPLPFLQGEVSQREEDPIQINNEAVKLIEAKEYDRAIRKLVTSLRLSPDSEIIRGNLAVAYAQRGVAAGERGRYHAALEDLRAAWKHDPANARYGYFLATFQYRMGALELAKITVRRALGLELAGDMEGKLKRLEGYILYLDEKLEDALNRFEACLDLDPKDRDAERMKSKIERELMIQKNYQEDITTYFRLVYNDDALDLSSGGALVCALEDERSKVCSDLNHFPRQRVTVILYDPGDFKKITESEGWVGGLFDRKIRIPLTEGNRISELLGGIVRHEYTHVVLYELAPCCPAWINEGIACYEQYGRGMGERKMRSLMEQGIEPLPFEQLPDSFFQTSDPNRVRLYYTQSYALMEYLIDHYGMGRIRHFLRQINKEGDWMKAFRIAFSRDFKSLEADWLDRLKSR
jgi:tetratricopeptide (TPR) repeat protein